MSKTITEKDVSKANLGRAQRMYEAYIANSGGLNYEGKKCPPWPELTPAVRGHWCAVALHAYGT